MKIKVFWGRVPSSNKEGVGTLYNSRQMFRGSLHVAAWGTAPCLWPCRRMAGDRGCTAASVAWGQQEVGSEWQKVLKSTKKCTKKKKTTHKLTQKSTKKKVRNHFKK